MRYNKEKLLKMTAVEFIISLLLSICMIDSIECFKLILFCLIVSASWLVAFGVANEIITF